jgi:hypothetical protein
MWRDRELEQSFPGLVEGNYSITSPNDTAYNSIAWAIGDTSQFWDDVGLKGYYWPPGVGSADSIDSWKRLFLINGYEESDSREFETGLEKIAIYVAADGSPSHVARQTETGIWTSKLGKAFDIQHWTLEALEGDQYGKIELIMQRTCKEGKRARS